MASASSRVRWVGAWLAGIVAGIVAGTAYAEVVRGPFSDEQTTSGNIGFTVTNHGRYGNDFRDRAESSFEFPAGSGHEHMIRAGLWIGGIVLRNDGGLDTLVTTGSTDGFAGSGRSGWISPNSKPAAVSAT